MAQNRKRPKEEREEEFLTAIEQVLGFPLPDWQKRIILAIRQDSLAGTPINIDDVKETVRLRKRQA